MLNIINRIIQMLRRDPIIIVGFVTTILSFVILAITLTDQQSSFTKNVSALILGVLGASTGVVVAYVSVYLRFRRQVPRVFFVYAQEDIELADKIYKFLQNESFIVLWDKKDIKVGDNILEKRIDLLIESDYVLFISSEHSTNSENILQELDYAIELNKKILPIKIDSSKPYANLENIMPADFSKSFEQGMSELLRGLKMTRSSSQIEKRSTNSTGNYKT